MDSSIDVDEICRELDRQEEGGVPFGRLLTDAVRKLHESSSRFDWTGIYELHPDGLLRLGPFIGTPTEQVFIGTGQDVCGSTVTERANMNVPDVSKAENYRACSATAKSELVVLIRDKDQIFGQIDIDSHELNAFDEDLVENVGKLASRLAGVYSRRLSQVA